MLRDPKGRSMFRSIHPIKTDRGSGLAVTGPFALHQIYSVTQDSGIAFVEATGDENPIHREGDIVPGAMTCARAVSCLESLIPNCSIDWLKVKFRAIAKYDRPMRQQLHVGFSAHQRMTAQVRISQNGKDVAEGCIKGTIKPEMKRPNIRKRRVNKEQLACVEKYFWSLRMHPDVFLMSGGEPNFAYPKGFLASLPSGEMVRQFSGEGGILSSLELKFQDGAPLAITGMNCPNVSLQETKSRPSFSKILTWIKSGMEEYCKGFALVFMPNVKVAAPKG